MSWLPLQSSLVPFVPAAPASRLFAGLRARLVRLRTCRLRDYNLPLFAEEMSPSMKAPELAEAVRLRANLEASDAVLFVTPEYNHSVSGALKNAIDYLPPATLKEKAVGLVGYSWYGAVKPLEHLREIVSTFGADVREQQVGINLGSDFQDGVFTPSEELNGQIRELLASLA